MLLPRPTKLNAIAAALSVSLHVGVALVASYLVASGGYTVFLSNVGAVSDQSFVSFELTEREPAPAGLAGGSVIVPVRSVEVVEPKVVPSFRQAARSVRRPRPVLIPNQTVPARSAPPREEMPEEEQLEPFEEADEQPAAALAPTASVPEQTATLVSSSAMASIDGFGTSSNRSGRGSGGQGTAPPRVQPSRASAARPSFVSSTVASYLRTYEVIPSLPRSLPRPATFTTLMEVCISAQGVVEHVVVRQSTNAELDRVLTAAVRSWRYRPRVVNGLAAPFCHLMRLSYEW